MKKNKKIFVLDTNVLLHDYKSIYSFGEHDIVIPIIVLEEVDKFKKGNGDINFHAREFARELDKLSGVGLFTDGISLGKGKGNLYIKTGKPFSDLVKNSFTEKTPDHIILATADYIRNEHPDRSVILITKDINLRMKAKSLGIHAENYESDNVKNIEQLHEAAPTFENIDDKLISKLYETIEGVSIEAFDFETTLVANQYLILKGLNSSVLARYDASRKRIIKVEKYPSYGIEPRNAEQAFSLDALKNPDIQLITLTGKAGTGKTLLALASALQQNKDYEQILLARPIVPLSNRDLGFLPGDVKDKIGPYMQPLFDNLSFIKHRFAPHSKEYAKIEELLMKERLIITPLAYIRGRSLSNVFFIIDEAQNLTPHEVKTIITRAGEGTKIVFTGDIQQIDSPYLDTESNGLSYLSDRMKGQEIFAHINLEKGERSQLAEIASDLL